MKYLKQLRKDNGLSQLEMAERLSVSLSHYVKLENGFVNPSFQLLKRINEEFIEFDLNLIFE